MLAGVQSIILHGSSQVLHLILVVSCDGTGMADNGAAVRLLSDQVSVSRIT